MADVSDLMEEILSSFSNDNPLISHNIVVGIKRDNESVH